MASTPLDDFLRAYGAAGFVRMHMPGHKGQLSSADITEIEGADSLYAASGVIAASEKRMADVYGAMRTAYSAGGSTLCIQAMLACCARNAARRRKLLCTRNLHVAAAGAMALLDLEPVCLYPADRPDPRLPGVVTAGQVREALAAHPDAAAVYLTCPDYYGQRCDLAAVAAVCQAASVPLLVDNAHGAHLRFLQPNLHPMALGASACCDSLHKTLPALTGAALLHIADERFCGREKDAMALFGSTSPSYLILQSIDRLLESMESGELARRTAMLTARCASVREAFAAHGLRSIDGDPTRIVVDAQAAGLSGLLLAEQLRAARIEPEYADNCFVVLLPSIFSSRQDFARLIAFAETFQPTAPYRPPMPPEPRPKRVMSLREAILSPAESLPVRQAVGRVAARSEATCPPGVPALLAGEAVDEETAVYLAEKGVRSVAVVRESAAQ